VAIDTNVFIFALRRTAGREHCRELVFGGLPDLRIHLPLQVLVELQNNLTSPELSDLFAALSLASHCEWGYVPANPRAVARIEELGAKKGDALISAQLEAAGVKWLVSENRHFLTEVEHLPFRVVSAADMVARLRG
jgi:predicted nucleic acid-binding protein